MKLSPELLKQLETPCIVIDMAQLRKNLKNMQDAVKAAGCKLRPHIKTHKMTFIAQMQKELGCEGITCAKVSEAEIMAAAGMKDIFIAYPQVGDFRLKRCIELSKKIDRLILDVDSLAVAELYEAAAAAADTTLEVRLEIDTGHARTGATKDKVIELAKKVNAMPHLNLTGIMTFKSLHCKNVPTTDIELAAKEEGELMEEYANELRAAGCNIIDISGGSTPTGIACAQTGKLTEVRPGTYVFYDYMNLKEGACKMEDIAVRAYATVVSTNHPDYAVIDGGSKTYPMDQPIDKEPYFYPGYTYFEGREDLSLCRVAEEHGMVYSKNGAHGLKVGDILTLIPIHICPAINMHNEVYLYEDGKLTKTRVDARGALI